MPKVTSANRLATAILLLLSATFAQAEMTDGIWRIDVKNGVFPRMLRDLHMEQYLNP